jgi:hypothetical protein
MVWSVPFEYEAVRCHDGGMEEMGAGEAMSCSEFSPLVE